MKDLLPKRARGESRSLDRQLAFDGPMKKPRGRGASLESVEARDQGRPRTGVGLVGGSGVVVSVGKRFVQKNGLT